MPPNVRQQVYKFRICFSGNWLDSYEWCIVIKLKTLHFSSRPKIIIRGIEVDKEKTKNYFCKNSNK